MKYQCRYQHRASDGSIQWRDWFDCLFPGTNTKINKLLVEYREVKEDNDMVYVYNFKKELTGQYDTIVKASQATGVTAFAITQCLQGKIKTSKGYVFSPSRLKGKRKKCQKTFEI